MDSGYKICDSHLMEEDGMVLLHIYWRNHLDTIVEYSRLIPKDDLLAQDRMNMFLKEVHGIITNEKKRYEKKLRKEKKRGKYALNP